MQSHSDDATALNLDTAVAAAMPPAGVTCAACRRGLDIEYFDVNGASVCAACRDAVVRQAQTPRDWPTLAKAVAFGIGAAIAGAILYYAVITITNLEIGLVAIAIGYMVGYAVKLATGGRGGRRFQVLALVLTYWAVGLAYLPLTIGAALEERAASSSNASSVTAAPQTSGTAGDGDGGGLVMSLVMLVGLSLALPVLSVAGSMPGGLISAAIIAFGMHQAWQMTASPQVQVSGPFRIGAEARG
jgi:hypothetical protein